jgi:hypothetical protein
MKNTELKKKERYSTNSQKQYITSEERVEDKKEDMREIGNKIIAHKDPGRSPIGTPSSYTLSESWYSSPITVSSSYRVSIHSYWYDRSIANGN